MRARRFENLDYLQSVVNQNNNKLKIHDEYIKNMRRG